MEKIIIKAMTGWPPFGALPSGERAQRIRSSANYRDGQFMNPEPTVMMDPSASMVKLMLKFFNKPKNTAPPRPLPVKIGPLSEATDSSAPVIVWFGHSSYYINYRGLTVLVDPVFSGHASPFAALGKAFKGSDVYNAEDFPKIDLLIITHDHYDHLDYNTIKRIAGRVGKIVTSLGVGAHLEAWGVLADKIIELDWWESAAPLPDIKLTAAPARHFSGRLFRRNQSLWSSFVMNWAGFNLYLGGDSGYGKHFKEIGDRFGPFRMAILESGQYNKDWPSIHMFPAQAPQACRDLRAEALLPVHWAKFALAFHPWNEPPELLMKAFEHSGTKLLIPMIGEPVTVGGTYPHEPWWEF